MKIDFAKGDGLVPVVVQHFTTGEVLMVGYGNAESLARCEETGELWLFSRSRQQLWHKGETSGHTQRIVSMTADCDRDAVLVRVAPNGPMCHTGERSCFVGEGATLRALSDVIAHRKLQPHAGSYTQQLLSNENLRLKKLGEEVVELAVACKDGAAERIAEEAADLIYHTLVACAAQDVLLEAVLLKLEARRAKRRDRDAAE
jgi:phosphoribosyl-ATP pyrophosphohydrolase/phosphoribosyl-AMP cyclohydrolase